MTGFFAAVQLLRITLCEDLPPGSHKGNDWMTLSAWPAGLCIVGVTPP